MNDFSDGKNPDPERPGFPPRRWLPWVVFVYAVVILVVMLLADVAYQMLLREIRNEVRSMATAIAFQVGDMQIDRIRQEPDMQTPEFQKTLAFYRQMKNANPDVRYIYSFRHVPGEESGHWRFIVDADPYDRDLDGDGLISKSEEGVRPGMEYVLEDPELIRLIGRAAERPVAGRTFTSDEYGTYISGYAPIKDPLTGKTIAIQGVDITREAILGKKNIVTYAAFGALGLLLVLVSFTLLAFFGKARALDSVRYFERQLSRKNRELSDSLEQLQEREQIMSQDLEMAREVQQQLLPHHFPFPGRLDFACVYQACALIGGDLYDVFRINNHLAGFYMADVCGHGVSAALVTAELKVAMDRCRQELDSDSELFDEELALKILNELNGMMADTTNPGGFITLLLGVLNMDTGELLLYNAGHNPPVHWSASGRRAQTVELPSNMALGIVRNYEYRVTRYSIRRGDKLIFYTDGLTERRNEKDQEFGTGRLLGIVAEKGSGNARSLLNFIMQENSRFAGENPVDDDLAVIVIGYSG